MILVSSFVLYNFCFNFMFMFYFFFFIPIHKNPRSFHKFEFGAKKPDQSFADDFLFPMTSRMSYTSSPESDGEFCDPDNSMSRAASRNPSLSHDVTNGGLARSNSDPNLARDDQVS